MPEGARSRPDLRQGLEPRRGAPGRIEGQGLVPGALAVLSTQPGVAVAHAPDREGETLLSGQAHIGAGQFPGEVGLALQEIGKAGQVRLFAQRDVQFGHMDRQAEACQIAHGRATHARTGEV